MPLIRIPRGWEIPGRLATPEAVYLNRRKFFKQLGAAGLGLVAGPALAEQEVSLYPAKRNPTYILDRPLTDEQVAASYNNFYEFTTDKEAVKEKVDKFQHPPRHCPEPGAGPGRPGSVRAAARPHLRRPQSCHGRGLGEVDVPRNKYWAGLFWPGRGLSAAPAQVHQADYGPGDGGEQPHGQPILVAQDTPAFDPPDAI